MSIQENLDALLKGIREGKIIETFDKYYHDDVVMFEKGSSENRVGKAQNRIAEQGFQDNATIHSLDVTKILVTGNNSAYESTLDFTYGGNRIKKTQWSIQEWKDGKIIKEEFYY